jgi:tetratricopeptide (TPR) repeat protein
MALFEVSMFDEALECFNKAKEINPKFAEAWRNKGRVIRTLGRYKAILYYDEAIKLDPKNPAAWDNKGNAHYTLSDNEKAVKCFNRAIELYANYVNAMNIKGLSLGVYDCTLFCYRLRTIITTTATKVRRNAATNHLQDTILQIAAGPIGEGLFAADLSMTLF